jgi:hypothetical protein
MERVFEALQWYSTAVSKWAIEGISGIRTFETTGVLAEIRTPLSKVELEKQAQAVKYASEVAFDIDVAGSHVGMNPIVWAHISAAFNNLMGRAENLRGTTIDQLISSQITKEAFASMVAARWVLAEKRASRIGGGGNAHIAAVNDAEQWLSQAVHFLRMRVERRNGRLVRRNQPLPPLSFGNGYQSQRWGPLSGGQERPPSWSNSLLIGQWDPSR